MPGFTRSSLSGALRTSESLGGVHHGMGDPFDPKRLMRILVLMENHGAPTRQTDSGIFVACAGPHGEIEDIHQ